MLLPVIMLADPLEEGPSLWKPFLTGAGIFAALFLLGAFGSTKRYS